MYSLLVIADDLTDIAYCIKPHIHVHIYDPRHEKTLLHIRKQMRGNHTANQNLCFAANTGQFRNSPNPRFQASNNLRLLYSPVCVGLGR